VALELWRLDNVSLAIDITATVALTMLAK